MIDKTPRPAWKLLLAVSLAIGAVPNDARASLISVDTAFGPETATLDTTTGFRWLDVTLSTPFSYDQLLPELAPGGVFAGYTLATADDVLALWAHAGIDEGSLGVFTSENFRPIVQLMSLVGITGLNTGNLDNVNFFDFTAGHIKSGPGGGGFVDVMTISADPDPTMTGRPDIGGVPSNNPNNEHGAWLFLRPVPEPGDTHLLLAGLVLLMLVRSRRRPA
jgi:hypothetical protein